MAEHGLTQQSLNWISHSFIRQDGYGRMGYSICNSIITKGVHLKVYTSNYLRNIEGISGHTFNPSLPTIQFMPLHELYEGVTGDVSVAYSMYESSKIPDGWSNNVNRLCNSLIVPCEELAHVFRDNGVTLPIHVIEGSFNKQEFQYEDIYSNRKEEPFTFLAIGDRGTRKGWDLVYTAFYKAFKNIRDVRLIIKTRESMGIPYIIKSSDPRIEIVTKDYASLKDIFRKAHTLIFPSRFEGWGLIPREATSMGLFTICSEHSGMDDASYWSYPLRRFSRSEAFPDCGGSGYWYEPDLDEIIESMLWSYENRLKLKALSEFNSKKINSLYDWDNVAQKILNIVR